MEFSNSDKSRHGKSVQESIEQILIRCLNAGHIVKVLSDYRIGMDGFENSKQFYAPFLVVFDDNSKWAIYTTTSMRTDRVKGQQWDALNLKNIDTDIKHAFLVYPDGVADEIKSEFIRQNNKYVGKIEFSAIDAIVSQDELCNLIEEYGIRTKNEGQKKDIQGKTFEVRVSDIINYLPNFLKWKNQDVTVEGMHYDLFHKIVECFGLIQNNTKSINASCDVGKLPSGGNPKTDVLVSVELDDTQEYYTISCKRSSSKSVSVHQYNADVFADVLDKNNSRLRELLKAFQTHGNLRDFGVENTEELTKILAPYVEKLSMWVLGGYGGAGDEKTQMAGYILIYDNNDNSTTIVRTKDYYTHLKDNTINGHFGTPFSWTYPSKRKGKDIQLKCVIIK